MPLTSRDQAPAPFTRLLVPLTGTPAIGMAVQTALRLAARYDLTLTGLHVVVPDTLPPQTPGDPGVGTPLDPTLMQFNDETLEFQGHAQRRARDALAVATTLSLEWSLPLEVRVVSNEDRGTMEALREARLTLDAHGVSARINAVQDDAGLALQAVADPDVLLVMGTHSHGTFLGFRRGHTVDTVLLGANGPVLLCP